MTASTPSRATALSLLQLTLEIARRETKVTRQGALTPLHEILDLIELRETNHERIGLLDAEDERGHDTRVLANVRP
jgi:hypothetical protein